MHVDGDLGDVWVGRCVCSFVVISTVVEGCNGVTAHLSILKRLVRDLTCADGGGEEENEQGLLEVQQY